MEPIVSFCVASYMRGQKTADLVKEILSYKKKLIEVIVIDDNSDDDTYEDLYQIKDTRLSIYKNKVNCGARHTWYLALDKGTGKWLFQVLDRDWIRADKIEEIIEIIENTAAGFGYCGTAITSEYSKKNENKKYQYYENGIQALRKFGCVPTHPTGNFFKNELWKRIRIKEKFFIEKKWGTYPHGYVTALMSIKYSGLVISSSICYCPKKIYNKYRNDKSRFYQKEEAPVFWWEPKSKMKELLAYTFFINQLKISNEWKKTLVADRFSDELYAATIKYKANQSDIANCTRYGIVPRHIGKLQLLRIALEIKIQYFAFIKNKNYQWNDKDMKLQLFRRMKIVCCQILKIKEL